ncbi:MAG: ATP-binding protein [Aquabacterium sp.]|uniref:hybrid sensor histidine kinase/response regulator n=1 Tax=Aquabacterium sp. TaxID=1872578 RepID=UPI003BE8D99E
MSEPLFPAAPPPSPSDLDYRHVFQFAGVGLARVNLEGYIIEVNQCFADITGRSRDDLTGLHVIDITHPDDVAISQAQMDAMLAGYQSQYALQKRYVRPNGQTVWTSLHVTLLRDELGTPQQYVAAVEDISDRLRAQEAMNSAKAAERASKAKTEFLSRMSHELRTPLNAMLGFAQLLRVDPEHPLDDAQREKVLHIEQAGSHLLAMLTDVLDLSRIEAGSLPMNIGAHPLTPVFDEALNLIQNQARNAGLQLMGAPPASGLCVRADPVRLRQILVNLLSNAIKYNRCGGRVMLEALPLDRHVVITVSDTGQGMSAEQISHLFEPFNRLGAERTTVEGTGIGLVIVKRLLELMQGRIEVSSTPGIGTSFRIWLPQGHVSQVAPAPAVRTGRSVFGALDHGDTNDQARVVLYAEDNVVNIELVRQVMRMRPQWRLEVAHSGQDAITNALNNPPDLLLLDMHLGDMSGLDVSDALSSQPETADIPRVALSADVMPDQIREARERGFIDYLTKPLDVGRLLKLLDKLAQDAEAA